MVKVFIVEKYIKSEFKMQVLMVFKRMIKQKFSSKKLEHELVVRVFHLPLSSIIDIDIFSLIK